jgi:Ca2+-binding EF-hand superfamily protein
MKRTLLISSFLALSLWAVDYSQMTTEQLIEMRGSVPVEDRDAFRAEMQSRLQTMTTEERAAFMASRQANGQGMRGGATPPTFAQFDQNGDGKISQEELDAARAARMNERAAEGKLLKNAGNAPAFNTLDKNGDGFIDAAEFQTQQQLHMQSRMNSMQGQRAGQMGSQGIQQKLQDGSGAGQMMRGANRGGHGRP